MGIKGQEHRIRVLGHSHKNCYLFSLYRKFEHVSSRAEGRVSVKFSSVIHLTVDNYYLRGFGFISISV